MYRPFHQLGGMVYFIRKSPQHYDDEPEFLHLFHEDL